MKFEDLIKDPKVANHPLLDGYHNQKSIGEYLSRDEFSDELSGMFAREIAGPETKGLRDFALEASTVLQDTLNQFDYPMAPIVRYMKHSDVKHSKVDPDNVVSGRFDYDVTFRTIKGQKRNATIPVHVNKGEIISPSILYVEGRKEVISQYVIDQLLDKVSFYQLPQIREQFDAPLSRQERENAASIRNDMGWRETKSEPMSYMTRRLHKRSRPVQRTRPMQRKRALRPPLIKSTGPVMNAAYKAVLDEMKTAENEGRDTFPRNYDYILRNYILNHVSVANKDQWMIPLINDGYCLNPYGVNVRVKRAGVKSWKALDRVNADIEKEMEMEINGTPINYEDTKIPMEVSDSVTTGKGFKCNIVEINPENNTIIVKSKGKEYLVSVSDIEPLPETVKKMEGKF